MAVSAIAAAAGASAAANAVTNITGQILNQYNAYKTRQFNREEAEKNRTFQKEMAQNTIKHAVQQANDLGISPSLVLGDHTNALGGSQASVGTPPPSNNMSPFAQISNVLIEQMKLKSMEEMNEDRLQTMKEIQNMKMANSTTANDYMKRNGFKNGEELNRYFTNNFSEV